MFYFIYKCLTDVQYFLHHRGELFETAFALGLGGACFMLLLFSSVGMIKMLFGSKERK